MSIHHQVRSEPWSNDRTNEMECNTQVVAADFPNKLNDESGFLQGDISEPKAPTRLVRTSFFIGLVVVSKLYNNTYGRTRIRRDIMEEIPGSESSIGRILRDKGLQNPPKRPLDPVELTLAIPEDLQLNTNPNETMTLVQPGNAQVLMVAFFREQFMNVLPGVISEESIRSLEVYNFALLAGQRLSYAVDSVPPEIAEFFYGGRPPRVKKIRQALVDAGKELNDLIQSLVPSNSPKAIAIDETVLEKWIKRNLIGVHENNEYWYVQYVSRRGKGLPAVSTEVVAAIDEEGVGIPITFLPTPPSDKKAQKSTQQKTKDKLKQGVDDTSSVEILLDGKSPKKTQQPPKKEIEKEPPHASKPSKSVMTIPKTIKKKATFVIALLVYVRRLVGQIPLRMDNGYGQVEVLCWLSSQNWSFIVHGHSNLKEVREVKEYAKQHQLQYYKRVISSERFGGHITVVLYCKHGKYHAYLTNEFGSAEEILRRYRARWRVENIFKWVPCHALLPGSDPEVHRGHQFLCYMFMTRLVHSFGASTPTIHRLLNQRCETKISSGKLHLRFPKLSTRYYKLLEKFTANSPPRWEAKLLLKQT